MPRRADRVEATARLLQVASGEVELPAGGLRLEQRPEVELVDPLEPFVGLRTPVDELRA
jgi:hypothetical protein